jgi:sugar phosphate isomerase/epimerase
MPRCELGCFNRPWNQFEFSDFLNGAATAGYTLAGFMRQKGESMLDADSPPGRAAELRAEVHAAGLSPSALFAPPLLASPIEEACAHLRRVVDVAEDAGCRFLLTCGTENHAHRAPYIEIIRSTADYAGGRGVMLTLKPHGGFTATARELVAIHDRIDHPNFGLFYDPGNVHYYTGQSAAEDVKSLGNRTVALCIKDNTGGRHGDVAIDPGTGEVDFGAVFGTLFENGFTGPCLVECLGGHTVDEINDSARRTLDFLRSHVAD